MNIYEIPYKDITEEMVKSEANKLASDPARKGELMEFFKIFGTKIHPKDKAEIIGKSVRTERDWVEKNIDKLTERNKKIFEDNFAIKNGYLPDAPATHPQNIRTQLREMKENRRIEELTKAYNQSKEYLEQHPDAIFLENASEKRVNMNMKVVRVMTKDGVVTVDVENKLKKSRGEIVENPREEAIKKQKNRGIMNNPLFKEEE